jgi:hypothetical protein
VYCKCHKHVCTAWTLTYLNAFVVPAVLWVRFATASVSLGPASVYLTELKKALQICTLSGVALDLGPRTGRFSTSGSRGSFFESHGTKSLLSRDRCKTKSVSSKSHGCTASAKEDSAQSTFLSCGVIAQCCETILYLWRQRCRPYQVTIFFTLATNRSF